MIARGGFPRPPARKGTRSIVAAIRAIPTEEAEQIRLVAWLDWALPDVPYFHVPNGGWRAKRTAGRMKALGAKPGVPDLSFPEPRGPWHGLYIEMKRAKGGQLSAAQTAWIGRLRRNGYRVEVCAGAEAAMAVIEDYFGVEAVKDGLRKD